MIKPFRISISLTPFPNPLFPYYPIPQHSLPYFPNPPFPHPTFLIPPDHQTAWSQSTIPHPHIPANIANATSLMLPLLFQLILIIPSFSPLAPTTFPNSPASYSLITQFLNSPNPQIPNPPFPHPALLNSLTPPSPIFPIPSSHIPPSSRSPDH